VKEGFVVLPYMPADPVLAKRLEEIGCGAVMPWARPSEADTVGDGGIAATHRADSAIPVIVDAGLRSPSEAAAALEMGCDAVLVNSAIAAAREPGRHGGGLLGSGSGRPRRVPSRPDAESGAAVATSPLTSFLSKED